MARFSEHQLSPQQKTFIRKALDLYQRTPEISTYPWAEKIEYPSKERFNKRYLIFEVMGFPESGKTHFVTLVEDLMALSYPHTVTGTITEFGHSRTNYQQLKDQSQTDTRTLGYFSSFMKTASCEYTELIASMRCQYNQSAVFVIDRGPNDAVAMSKATESTTPYGVSHLDLEDYDANLKVAINQSRIIDGILLYRLDLETAIQRRVQQGLYTHGRVTNPELWPVLEMGYTWWLSYYYPLLRKSYGTGIRTIDGEGDIADNVTRAYEYVKKCMDLLPI